MDRKLKLMKKREQEVRVALQKEFENEKQLRKERFNMQLSKYMKSGQSLEELDENEEKRELAIYFEHIEKKNVDKLDERKKELKTKYEKVSIIFLRNKKKT